MAEVNLYESQALRTVSGPVIRPGGFQLTDRGLALCRMASGARMLDVGCGTGAVVDYVRRRYGLAAVGIDFSAVLLEDGARNYCGMPLVRGRGERLPFVDGFFEVVLCECVLSLCPEPLKVLHEIRRVLQPGGYAVLTDVYARWSTPDAALTDGPSVHCCLRGAVDRVTVEDRIAAAGYDALTWEDHSLLLKQLAAQLVWTYGSIDAFWSAIGDGSCAHGTVNAGLSGSGGGAGYYLMVARKPDAD